MVERSKTGKAVGVDNIANELLKNDKVMELLHKFFNACLRTLKIPDVWRKAIIHPIPKEPGKVINPLKYRGLALQCCIYKILSGILNDRLTNYLERARVIEDEQNGFRKSRSCSQHVFTLLSAVRNKIRNGTSVFCCFVDFRKAFDFTDRELLYH